MNKLLTSSIFITALFTYTISLVIQMHFALSGLEAILFLLATLLIYFSVLLTCIFRRSTSRGEKAVPLIIGLIILSIVLL